MTFPATDRYRQEEKNRAWLAENDLATSGGGGGTIVSDAINGLVRDYSPPGGIDGVSSLLLDPRAQPWQADHEFSNDGNGGPGTSVGAYVTPSTNPNEVKFLAFENGSFVTGSVEPDWNSEPAADGTADRPAEWSHGGGSYDVWVAETEIGSGNIIFESGSAWQCDGGGASGVSKPDFSSQDVNDTVTDGAITWTNLGPAYGEWQAGTRYSFRVNTGDLSVYGQPFAVPVGATPGVTDVWVAQPTSNFGTTGDTEPDWGAVMPADASTWIDGDIMWVEATSGTESLVLTGIEAPADTAVVTVFNAVPPGENQTLTLEDESQVESDYFAEAASDPGNLIANNGGNLLIAAGQAQFTVYVNDQWQPFTQP